MDENVETQEVAQNETSVNFSSTDIMLMSAKKEGISPCTLRNWTF